MKEILFREDRETAASVIKADRMGTLQSSAEQGKGFGLWLASVPFSVQLTPSNLARSDATSSFPPWGVEGVRGYVRGGKRTCFCFQMYLL